MGSRDPLPLLRLAWLDVTHNRALILVAQHEMKIAGKIHEVHAGLEKLFSGRKPVSYTHLPASMLRNSAVNSGSRS